MAKRFGIIPEGANNVTITSVTTRTVTRNDIEYIFYDFKGETDEIMFKWSLRSDFIYDGLIAPAVDAGWTGTEEDSKSLMEFVTGKTCKVWHTDTKKAGPYRHRYYINEIYL